MGNPEFFSTKGGGSFTATSKEYGLQVTGVDASTPVPEIDPAGLGSVLALVTGALGPLERRRDRG